MQQRGGIWERFWAPVDRWGPRATFLFGAITAIYKAIGGAWSPPVVPVVSIAFALWAIALAWGWNRIRFHPKKRIAILIALCLSSGFWLGWTRVGGLLTDAAAERRSSSSTWMVESDAIDTVQAFYNVIYNGTASRYQAKKHMEDWVKDGSLEIRWRLSGADGEWRYDLPLDSIEIVLETLRFGSEAYSDALVFEREYYASNIRSHTRPLWPEPNETNVESKNRESQCRAYRVIFKRMDVRRVHGNACDTVILTYRVNNAVPLRRTFFLADQRNGLPLNDTLDPVRVGNGVLSISMVGQSVGAANTRCHWPSFDTTFGYEENWGESLRDHDAVLLGGDIDFAVYYTVECLDPR